GDPRGLQAALGRPVGGESGGCDERRSLLSREYPTLRLHSRSGDLRRSRLRGGGLAMAGMLACAAARAEGLPARIVYTRADVLAAVTGEVVLRRAYTRQMQMPTNACEGEPFTCTADQLYGQVYSLAFVEETLTQGSDGRATVDRKSRGRLLIAVNLSKEEEIAFEDGLLARVATLGVAEFARPRAGMGWMEPPLTTQSLM